MGARLKLYRRPIKWLIIGLEIPLLSLAGLLLGHRLAGGRFDLVGSVGMTAGATFGLIAGALILYVIASRTYRKDRRAAEGVGSPS